MRDIGFSYKVFNPYLVAAIAVMGGLLFGFDVSSMSSLISNDNYVEYFGTGEPGDRSVSAMRQAGITASMAGGSFLGSLVSGPTSDKLGGKPVLQMAAWIWIIGCAIQCSAINMAQLIMGRIIGGFGVGFASSQAPVYVAEMSPKRLRGALVGVFQWFVTWGILIMFYIGYGCGHINGPASFRAAWGIMMIPGLVFFVGTLFLTESPRWLAAHEKWEDAIYIISHVQAKGDENDENVRIEVEEIKGAVYVEQNSKFRFYHLFSRKNIRRTFIGATCQMWQQLTGMNVEMYYITTIFSFAGYEGDSNLIASSIQYVINVVMTIPALLFVDRWGRRRVMFYGAIIMMAWMIAMAAVLGQYSYPLSEEETSDPQVRIMIPKSEQDASKGLIAITYLFVATYAPTWGPVGWIYCSEIFPLEQRATANALCASVNWIFNLAIALFSPQAFVSITWQTYIIFAVFCFTMALHVFLMYPETHGLTLEEVSELWEADIPAWKTSKWRPTIVPQIADIDAAKGGGAPSLKDKVEPSTEHIDDVSFKSQELSA